jgi:hypothetical protein
VALRGEIENRVAGAGADVRYAVLFRHPRTQPRCLLCTP